MIDDFLGPTRKTVVTSVTVDRLTKDQAFFPTEFAEERGVPNGPVWLVRVSTRTGFSPVENHESSYVLSETKAQEVAANFPVGSETDHPIKTLFMDNPHFMQGLPQLIDAGFLGRLGSAGDEESPLAFEVLEEAGLCFGHSQISEDVLAAMDVTRVEQVKSKFGDNWSVALLFEYCWRNLPHSSPAYLAAAYQFHHYITQDDFSAGYHWRDMELAISGVEAEASKALEMRRNAGAKGSESSARARKERVKAVMAAIEHVAQRNPDIAAALGPKSLLAVAIPKAVDANPSLWVQGQGQAEEYLGEIQRGEAGEGLQSRYLRIFPKKTA
ncbi:MAG: hypothetical protein AB8B71_19795 [Paracoccaceae bacterium]